MGLGKVGMATMDHRKGMVHRGFLPERVATGKALVMRSQNLKGWEKSIPDRKAKNAKPLRQGQKGLEWTELGAGRKARQGLLGLLGLRTIGSQRGSISSRDTSWQNMAMGATQGMV